MAFSLSGISRARNRKGCYKKTLLVFRELEPDDSIGLHTQTWSRITIRLYHSLGFNLVRNGRLADTNTSNGKSIIYKNDYPETTNVLKTVMETECINDLINTGV